MKKIYQLFVYCDLNIDDEYDCVDHEILATVPEEQKDKLEEFMHWLEEQDEWEDRIRWIPQNATDWWYEIEEWEFDDLEELKKTIYPPKD